MDGRELRRSYTQVEFPVRSRQDYNGAAKVQQARTSKKFMMSPSNRSQRVEATPGDGASKLNVNAKEFVSSSRPSSSSGSTFIQTSKSTGNVLAAVCQVDCPSPSTSRKSQVHFNNKTTVGYPLHHSKSHGLNGFRTSTPAQARMQRETLGESSIVGDKNNNKVQQTRVTELKRSKSMTSTHNSFKALSLNDSEPVIPPAVAKILAKATIDPNQATTSDLIELSKEIIYYAMNYRKYAERFATCCANIVETAERDSKCTFLESILNYAQYNVNHGKPENGSLYGLLAFISHLYTLIKRQSLEKLVNWPSSPPNIMLLFVLVQCCQEILKEPLGHTGLDAISPALKIECLFFVVTTVGRDLEVELPRQLDSLICSVRDAFMRNDTPMEIKKTLIQLIELKASNWQLPAYTVCYYQSPAILQNEK